MGKRDETQEALIFLYGKERFSERSEKQERGNTMSDYQKYQKASNDYDMLKGCVNRMFVTDDKEELPRLYEGAMYYLDLIYRYGCERLDVEYKEVSPSEGAGVIKNVTAVA